MDSKTLGSIAGALIVILALTAGNQYAAAETARQKLGKCSNDVQQLRTYNEQLQTYSAELREYISQRQ